MIAHELGHLKCDHGIWLSLANIFASSTVSVLPIISSAVEEGLLRYSHIQSPILNLPVPEISRHRSALLQVKLASDHHQGLVLWQVAEGSRTDLRQSGHSWWHRIPKLSFPRL